MKTIDLTTQLLHTVVPVWIDQGGTKGEFATAFIVTFPVGEGSTQSIPFAVTTRHVMDGAKRIVVEFAEADSDDQPSQRRIRAGIPFETAQQHINRELDLVAIPLAPVLGQLESSGRRIYIRSITPDLLPTQLTIENFTAFEDVVLIGYTAGIYDDGPLIPIVRRGITATPLRVDFENKPAFLVDASLYPGCSGSPVFIYVRGYYPSETRAFFVGVLTDPVLATSPIESSTWPVGLARAIKSANVWTFLTEIVSRVLYSPRGA